MSNRNKSMKKNKKSAEKKVCFLAAIALSAALFGGQLPMEVLPVYATESQNDTPGSVIPDNITIDEPMALADIGLPETAYGTLEWADGSYVPDRRVQSCEVILTPAQGVDLSNISGWDAETGTVTGYINVIVSSISGKEDSSADHAETEVTATPSGAGEENTELPGLNVTGTPIPSVTGTLDGDNSDILVPSEDSSNEEKSGDSGENSSDETLITDKNKENSQAGDSENGDSEIDSEENSKEEENKKETTASDDNEDAENEDNVDQKDHTDGSDEENKDDHNIFDNPISPDEKDDRPSDADEELSDEEKAARAEMNHTCDGITVSGINLPWYVQFRVSSGESYQFTNESDAMIFRSYEFELWDLQNNTEYEIPGGEYISVTVPVKAGYDYTIEHLLDNGATETIIPSVDGDTMVFSTHSFSPFGIAGSKQLVGPDTGDDTEDTGTTVTVTPTPSASAQTTPASGNQSVDINDNNDNNSGNTGSNNSNTDCNSDTGSNDAGNISLSDNSGSSGTQTDSIADSTSSKNSKTVNTGDTTTILPFVVLFLTAAVIAGVVVFIKRKKK